MNVYTYRERLFSLSLSLSFSLCLFFLLSSVFLLAPKTFRFAIITSDPGKKRLEAIWSERETKEEEEEEEEV